jgi:septum formation protein
MLILASASPRRKELLERAGLRVDVRPAAIDETVQPDEPPLSYALRLARAKAAILADLNPLDWVIAADTVVIADRGAVLGKPRDEAEARTMLERLAGHVHRVATGYCIRGPGTEEASVVSTEVEVAPLSPHEIAAYLACGEWRDKAGAYAIQGIFGYAIVAVRGSYTNVVGLPLHEVLADLQRVGAIREFPPHGFRL